MTRSRRVLFLWRVMPPRVMTRAVPTAMACTSLARRYVPLGVAVAFWWVFVLTTLRSLRVSRDTVSSCVLVSRGLTSSSLTRTEVMVWIMIMMKRPNFCCPGSLSMPLRVMCDTLSRLSIISSKPAAVHILSPEPTYHRHISLAIRARSLSISSH